MFRFAQTQANPVVLLNKMENCDSKYFYTSISIELLLLVVATYAIVIQSLTVAMPGIIVRWIIMIGLYFMLYKSKLWAKVTLIIFALLGMFTGIAFTLANLKTTAFINPGTGAAILMVLQILLISRIKINQKIVE